MNCPSCDTVLRSDSCPCGWRDVVSPVPSQKYEPAPPGISKEEFGLNLYETIKTIGGLLGIEQQRAAAIHYHQGFKVKDLLKRRQALQAQLAKLLPTLNDSEMDQILARYPWVTRC